jgi:hypothetical protein
MNHPPSSYLNQETPESPQTKIVPPTDTFGQIHECETVQEKLKNEYEIDEWDNFGDTILFI